jgi:hypothetical protein
MSKLKPLKSAYDDLKGSLHEWMRARKEGKFSEGSHEICDEISRRIDEAAIGINASVSSLKKNLPDIKKDRYFLKVLTKVIEYASVDMDEAVKVGTDAILDHCKAPEVFVKWQALCGSVESFARSAAKELADSWSKYLWSKHYADSDRSLFNAVYSSLCILEETADVALRYRKRGIKGCLEGPLSEYAREDANLLGL